MPELDGGELPDAVRYLWDWYRELGRGRGAGAMGPAPLGWQDVRAWSELMAVIPTPQEVEILLTLDRVFLGAILEKKA